MYIINKQKPDIVIYTGDFLDKDIHLPRSSKVISNPPYHKVVSIPENWVKYEHLIQPYDFE